MPTPVSTARQCLTQESSEALYEAVAVARRRGHAQTSSLHMVSSLLAIPSSDLREACSRTRNNAYSTRIQFKALELCLGASLDRLATSSKGNVEEPPVSNSLMAAIKRSQASQRRQPENFNFYQQQLMTSSSSSVISVVKVELQNLILSILDDPVVSRVFSEAGFRSCDIKVAILRPVHRLFKYSRYKGPPMFLCNLSEDHEINKRGFSFPFLGFSGVVDGEENYRRISELMMAKIPKNPLLLGVYAYDALKGFLEMVQKGRGRKVESCFTGSDYFPTTTKSWDQTFLESTGMKIFCVEDEILRFVNGNCDEGTIKMRFEEVYKMVENCVVNVGDMKIFAGCDVSIDALSFVVGELGNLLKKVGVKVWLICSVAMHETYLKIVNRFPSIENDWNLQILPITSFKPSSVGDSYPRSSLMESFVPFGGLFSMPSDKRSPVSNVYQSVSRCNLCNTKCEEEISGLSKGGLTASVADRYQSSLPLWLQMTSHTNKTGFDEAKDDRMEPSTRTVGLERKWDSICQRHGTQILPKSTTQIPSITGFRIVEDHKKKVNKSDGNISNNEDDHTSPSSVTSVATNKELQKPECGSNSNHTSQSSSCSNPDTPKQFNVQDFKELYASLIERIGYQEEAVYIISQTISRRRLTNEKHYGRSRKDIWLSLHGPDTLRKKKLAVALSELLYGNSGNLISVDLGSRDVVTLRGKNVIDCIAEKLIKKPLSVVFLENIDDADLQVQNSLSQAIKTGRFSDSHGREIGIGNATFVTTLKFVKEYDPLTSEDTAIYSEEGVLKAKGCPIQMVIGYDLCDDDSGPIKEDSNLILMNKRKLIGVPEITKRAHKASNSYLDLNTPAEESILCDTFLESIPENTTREWLEGFVGKVDEVVVFKPFDFDALAQEILTEIKKCLNDTVGVKCLVEMDKNVMEQILAAAYFADIKKIKEWVHNVVRRGVLEAREKYSFTDRSVVKFVSCEGEQQIPAVYLPDSILVN